MGRRPHDGGFTLIELLVVMIIIGTLAAIAIPVYLTQRSKAHDAGVEADVSNLGKEVATFFIDGNGSLSLVYSPGTITLTDGASTAVARLTLGSVPPSTGASSNLNDPSGWCVALTDPKGSTGRVYRYSASSGLEVGSCP